MHFNVCQISRCLGLSRATVYKYLDMTSAQVKKPNYQLCLTNLVQHGIKKKGKIVREALQASSLSRIQTPG